MSEKNYDAPARVHINRALLREIADNAREQGLSPKQAILDKTGIPYNTVELVQTLDQCDIAAMPCGALRETFEALAMLLGEDIPLATREWLIDPQIHPRMLGWYTSLETYVRRQADKPGKKGDMGWAMAPGYDGHTDDEEVSDKFWVIPDAICLWTGKPALELFRVQEMVKLQWNLLRDPEAQVTPKTYPPRYLPHEGGWVPPAKPGYSPALLPWKTLKADCEWWMRLGRPAMQEWNAKLSRPMPAEKHLVGGLREFQHLCVGHTKAVIIRNTAPVWDCPRCQGPMITESWDKIAGIPRRNRGAQWERMQKDIDTLEWLRDSATAERKANALLAEDGEEPVWLFAHIYASTLKKWLGNTIVLEMESAWSGSLPGTMVNDRYHEVRRYSKPTATTPEERAEMRRKHKKVLHATYETIEEVMTQHDRAVRKIRKTYARRMDSDLGITWLPMHAAGELAPAITQHVIHVAEKFGHRVEQFNPLVSGDDTLTWAIKCYFGWSEREAYRKRVHIASEEPSGGGWNRTSDLPDDGQQRHHPDLGHQVFHEGYWVSFAEYREEVPARIPDWDTE